MKKIILLITLILATACVLPPLTSGTATPGTETGEPRPATSVDIPAAPVLSVSVTPSALMQGAQATVHVRVQNAGTADWEPYNLVVGYGVEGGSSVTQIETLTITLSAGQVFEQDVSWTVDFTPEPDSAYQIELLLLMPDGTLLGEAAAPVAIVQPALTLSLDPLEPRMGSRVVITVQVINPSGADMDGITLIVGHGPAADSSMFPIQEIPLSIQAGETFSQEIPWVVNYSLSGGDYQIKAILIDSDNVLIVSTEAPLTLPAP
jgi:hypothetical protein